MYLLDNFSDLLDNFSADNSLDNFSADNSLDNFSADSLDNFSAASMSGAPVMMLSTYTISSL